MSVGAYTGEEWRKARSVALSRDGHRCQDCGSEEDLHAHHITPVSEFDLESDAHYPENLVTLCKYCHPTWESRNARPLLLDSKASLGVRDVVDWIVEDWIDQALFGLSPTDAFHHRVSRNSNICNNCFGRMTSEGCSRCGSTDGRADDRTLSKREAIRRAGTLADRLDELGEPVDAAELKRAVGQLKSYPDLEALDTEIFATATKICIRRERRRC